MKSSSARHEWKNSPMPFSPVELSHFQRKAGNPLGPQSQVGPRKLRRIWTLTTMLLPASGIFEPKFLNWSGLANNEITLGHGLLEKPFEMPCASSSAWKESRLLSNHDSMCSIALEAKCVMGLLLNNPAFFPLQLPVMTGDYVSQRSDRIQVIRYGPDDGLLSLKGNCRRC